MKKQYIIPETELIETLIESLLAAESDPDGKRTTGGNGPGGDVSQDPETPPVGPPQSKEWNWESVSSPWDD